MQILPSWFYRTMEAFNLNFKINLRRDIALSVTGNYTDSASVEESCRNEKKRKLILLLTLPSLLDLEFSSKRATNLRASNIHRDRAYILRWEINLDDTMFRRQFRLCREDFVFVENLIKCDVEPDGLKI